MSILRVRQSFWERWGEQPVVFRGAGLSREAINWTHTWWKGREEKGFVKCSMEVESDGANMNCSGFFEGHVSIAKFVEELEMGIGPGRRVFGRVEVEGHGFVDLVLGLADQSTILHTHRSVEVLMIEGEKKFYMVSPEDTERLCSGLRADSGGDCMLGLFASRRYYFGTRGDIIYDDIEVDVYEVVLEPGDLLYIPGLLGARGLWCWG